MAFSLTQFYDAALFGAFASTAVYGIYIGLALNCSILLWRKHRERRANLYLTITHVLLFILITARCFHVAWRAMKAHSYANLKLGVIDVGSGRAPENVSANAIWVIIVVLSDMFMVFRTYVIWKQRCYVIILPISLVLASIAMAAVNLATLNKNDSPASSLATSSIMAYAALTAAVNLTCTGLIAYRIIGFKRDLAEHRLDGRLKKMVTLVVESAAISTLISLCIIISFAFESVIAFIFLDIYAPTMGIVFCSIYIRVSKRRSEADDCSAPTMSIQFRYSNDERENEHTTGTRSVTVPVEPAMKLSTATLVPPSAAFTVSERVFFKDGPDDNGRRVLPC